MCLGGFRQEELFSQAEVLAVGDQKTQQFKWPYGLSVVLSRRSSSALPAATLGVAVALPPVFQAVGFQAAHDRLALRSPETSGNAVGDVGRNRATEEGIETDSKVRPSTWFVG